MFRRLITDLSYSPSLIGEVSLYAQKLRKEQKIRLIGLVLFTIAAAFYTFTLLYPAESSNAANQADIISGGFENKNQLIQYYDDNTQNFKDIASNLGITRDDLLTTKLDTIKMSDPKNYVASRISLSGKNNGEVVVNTPFYDDYSRPIYLTKVTSNLGPIDENRTYKALTGKSKSIGNFAIIKNSGDIVLKSIPEDKVKKSDFKTQIILNNISKSSNNDTNTLNSYDLVKYTIIAKNKSDKEQVYDSKLDVSDVMEYGDIIDSGSAILDDKNKTLNWSSLAVQPGESTSYDFSVHVKSTIPATAQGSSNSKSYDCIMQVSADNTIQAPVRCPTIKIFEIAAHKLPRVNKTYVYTFNMVVLITLILIYLTILQYRKEIKIIRNEINQGTL